MEKIYTVDICGRKEDLPVLPLPNGMHICFFNLHGNPGLTEFCGKELAKAVEGCDVLITAESKGLQLTHVIARELGHEFYAVCRKSKKLYMQDGISTDVKSITTGNIQTLYLSRHDADLLKGKKVAIIDDVIDYAIRLVSGTHPELDGAGEIAKKYIKYGASPRAAQALITCAKVRALINGSYNVSFADIDALAKPVLRHRIKINYNAINDRHTVDDVVDMLVKATKR